MVRLSVVSAIGRESAGNVRGRNSSALVLLAFALAAAGGVCAGFGRIGEASISRQREFLADVVVDALEPDTAGVIGRLPLGDIGVEAAELLRTVCAARRRPLLQTAD